MNSRNFWLVVAIWCFALGGLVTCASVCGSGVSGPAVGSDIDLEAVSKAFMDCAQAGTKDLICLEKAIASKKLYTGEGKVSCGFGPDGSIVGFVDKDGDSKFSKSKDQLVFRLEVDKPSKHLIASDRHDRHYRSFIGPVLGLYLLSQMSSRHYRHYGRWHNYGYRSYVGPGYYTRTRARSSSSRRWGSGSGGRSYGGSGGWRGGK